MIYTITGCTPQAHGSRDILLRNMHAPDSGKLKRMGLCYFEENRGGQVVEMTVGRITAAMALRLGDKSESIRSAMGPTLGGLAEGGGQAGTSN